MFAGYASGEWQKNVAHGLGNYVHHAKGQVGLQDLLIRNLSWNMLSVVLDCRTIPFCRWERPRCFRLPNTQVNGTRTCNMVSASGDLKHFRDCNFGEFEGNFCVAFLLVKFM